MNDQRIQYEEEMVGANHPTKPDTLNRLALVEAGQDGHGNFRYLAAQAEVPATGAQEGVLYGKTVTGQVEAHYRGADNGGEIRLTCQGDLADVLRPRRVTDYLADDQAPPENDQAQGAIRFANSGDAWVWSHFRAWLGGVAWRLKLEAMMSTGEASLVGLNLAYQVFGMDAVMNPVKKRWQASTAYVAGDQRLPPLPNGFYYQATAAGTSAAGAPAWPTTLGNTVSDGGVTWRCQGAGPKNLSLPVTAPGAAYDRFEVDSALLQIPASAVNKDDRVHWALWRNASDAHGGDLLLLDAWLAPVEV